MEIDNLEYSPEALAELEAAFNAELALETCPEDFEIPTVEERRRREQRDRHAFRAWNTLQRKAAQRTQVKQQDTLSVRRRIQGRCCPRRLARRAGRRNHKHRTGPRCPPLRGDPEPEAPRDDGIGTARDEFHHQVGHKRAEKLVARRQSDPSAQVVPATRGAAIPRLLTVAEVASRLAMSPRTIRRWIKQQRLVAHRFGTNVRVDAEVVARLLTQPSEGSVSVVEARTMEVNDKKGLGEEEARLLRQLPRSKVWTAWLDFREIPLGTTDESEAVRRLARMVKERRQMREAASGDRPFEHEQKRRPYRVYAEAGRFVVKYYDATGRRRKHWIPKNTAIPVVTETDAEAYACRWYRGELDNRPGSATADNESSYGNLDLFHGGTTLEAFGRLWTSGKLAERFPDHVKRKSSSKDDISRLQTYVYPLIGAERVSSFEGRAGLELVERVVLGLPPVGPTFKVASRRQVLQAVHRLLTLAVYPAKLLTANPLPRGFVPTAKSDRAKSYLYPDEDRRLMGDTRVPLQHRLFYGLLSREGLRVSELLDLTWTDLDIERGVLTLDENKTDEPRAWAMNPGVASALKKWRERFVPKASGSTTVLADAKRRRIERYGVAERLRKYLREAGVERPQLFEATTARIALRAHDLRATFVTLSLSEGKSEAWIVDRTGHKSSQMIYRYRRAARTHVELGLGPLAPLDEAIPEFR